VPEDDVAQVGSAWWLASVVGRHWQWGYHPYATQDGPFVTTSDLQCPLLFLLHGDVRVSVCTGGWVIVRTSPTEPPSRPVTPRRASPRLSGGLPSNGGGSSGGARGSPVPYTPTGNGSRNATNRSSNSPTGRHVTSSPVASFPVTSSPVTSETPSIERRVFFVAHSLDHVLETHVRVQVKRSFSLGLRHLILSRAFAFGLVFD
jgi:hypothetical protein